jgi:hypothetical protein
VLTPDIDETIKSRLAAKGPRQRGSLVFFITFVTNLFNPTDLFQSKRDIHSLQLCFLAPIAFIASLACEAKNLPRWTAGNKTMRVPRQPPRINDVMPFCTWCKGTLANG